jgi:antirestriction protein ArdC
MKPTFKKIVDDNERAIARALADNRNIEAYLLGLRPLWETV